MKYYKLVNDIPMFKKGDLFFIHPEEECLLQKDTLRLAYHKKTLEKNPEILKNWFEEVEESENKRWMAKENGEYCYIDDYMGASACEDWKDNADNFRYSTGNYFKTKEEAKNYKEYLLARQVLLDDAEGGKFIESDGNWYAIYSLIIRDYRTTYTFSYYSPGAIYFRTEEALKKSLMIHKEQWEIVRKYEMSEE